jgi:two-component system KDP operon response regulator KdpE
MAYLLIVDDDIDGAAALAARLRKEGHDAHFVASVPAAMTRLRQRRPDLLLLDIGMPDFDGLEMLRALHADPRYEDLRVVVFSGSTDPQVRTSAVRLGALDFIPKSLGWSDILARITQHIAEDDRPAA